MLKKVSTGNSNSDPQPEWCWKKEDKTTKNKPPNAGKTVNIQPDRTPHLSIGMLQCLKNTDLCRQTGV